MYSHSPYPELVTGEKLLAFLEHNKGREAKNKPGHVIGIETYLVYVNSIVDLYTSQVRFKILSRHHTQ
jgi:hypothetical protein